MNQAGRSRPAERTVIASNGSPRSVGRDPRRVAARVAGPDAVGERESIGEPERRRGGGRHAPRRDGPFPMPRRGRHRAADLSSVRVVRRAPTVPAYTSAVAKRDPRAVLGVEPGATPTQIKAAWRRLARTHHPDLTGDDPAASRVATRQMAEINDAYAALTRDRRRAAAAADRRRRARRSSRASPASAAARRRPKPTRPVTGRVDMSATSTGPATRPSAHGVGASTPLARPAAAPRPTSSVASRRGPRRRPGPLVRDRVRHFRRPPPPSLDAARGGTSCDVRQVPRPHARPDRRVRAVLHRLGRGHRHPRSGPRGRGARRPGRPRPARDRPPGPSGVGAPAAARSA